MAGMTASCRTNDLNPDKGEVGGSVHPGPPIIYLCVGSLTV